MRIFPPQTTAYATSEPATAGARLASSAGTRRTGQATPWEPDTSGPHRFLFSLLWRQRGIVAANALTGIVWFGAGAINPYLVGRAIDDGVRVGDVGAVARWATLLAVSVAVGILGGVAMHTTAVASWLVALYRTTAMVVNKTLKLGHILPRRTPTGEVLSVSASDSDTFGMLAEVVARAVGALVAFTLVLTLMFTTSPKLALVILIVSPLLVMGAGPLLKPLSDAQAKERSRNSELTSLATDIVAGLRILRGIGGEATFGRNYARQSQHTKRAAISASIWGAAVEALAVALSGILLVVLTWLGVEEMLADRLSVGELISFFGYALFLIWPLATLFEIVMKWVQAAVAARKTIAVLSQRSPWITPEDPRPLAPDATLVDIASGVTIRPGRLTVIVSGTPDDSAALADRLGRYLPASADSHDGDDSDVELKGKARKQARAAKAARRAEIATSDDARARAPWGVTADGIDLRDIRIDDVRRRIVVSDTSAGVFAGTLQAAVDPHGTATRAEAERALTVASAEDVFDALPEGWQGRIDERGRGLSGGQRQRVVLARAILADPDTLVLVEPTSAVDAHTEARIVARLAEHRRGRTTVVTSVSPLWLHHADAVAFLIDGSLAASGTHDDLLADARYRGVVARGEDA